MLELFINKQKNEKHIFLLENGNLVEMYVQEENDNRNEGNIYIGIVKDIVKGMQSAFVDIGTKKNSFIHKSDLIKKVDVTKERVSTNIDIKDLVSVNDKILVQVKKDSNEQKGARISTHINLPSKYIVLMPNTEIITISQKIDDKKEQQRLIDLVKRNLSLGNGAVIRTSAKGKEKEIIEDIKDTEKKWKDIIEEYSKSNINEPRLIYKNDSIEKKMIIDLSNKNLDKIVVNDKSEYNDLKNFIQKNKEFKNIRLSIDEEFYVNDIYGIEKQMQKVKNRKIWLKCGGFITIDKTEALTAIDVNTGKYTGNNNLEQTVCKVNEEATIEIARQLRLRDIGGIIIIDYIDMKEQKNRNSIEQLLKKCLKNDRSKTQVEGFTKLDLMEMTRKHICSHKD